MFAISSFINPKDKLKSINFVGKIWEVLHCNARYLNYYKFHHPFAVNQLNLLCTGMRGSVCGVILSLLCAYCNFLVWDLRLKIKNVNVNFWKLQTTNNVLLFHLSGPKPKTIDDFWRMIFEHKCSTIVMLRILKEMGKVQNIRW